MTNIFDNASSVIHDNKRVASIVTGDGGVIYETSYVEFTFTGRTLTQDNSGSFSGTDMIIDYGDGTVETSSGKFGHTYSKYGTYTIKIYGATNLEDSCFRNCEGIISISIPNTITNIGMYCFYSCTDLTSITLPNNITTIGGVCFMTCIALTSINIPNSVTSIGGSCFRNCFDLTSIILNWTTSDEIITYSSSWIANANANLKFEIPAGTKSLYIAKGYPSDKLDDGTVISSVNLSATKTILSKSHNDTTTLTATVIDSNNQSVSGETIQIYNGNTLIGTMTESNGTYSYIYTSQGSGDLSLTAKCNDVSSSPIPIQDYLLVPPLNGTDAITKWTKGTNNTSNGIFTSHGSFLTNDWSNDGLWQLDFDYKYTNTRYIGVLFLCNNVNITSDSLMGANAWGVWEGGFPPTWGSLSIISSPSSFSKPSQTSWNHITIQKIANNQVKLILNNNYEWVYQLNSLPNWSSLHFGSKNNPSSPNTGGNIQFQNIVVKPL